jgi:hypothetical protein
LRHYVLTQFGKTNPWIAVVLSLAKNLASVMRIPRCYSDHVEETLCFAQGDRAGFALLRFDIVATWGRIGLNR